MISAAQIREPLAVLGWTPLTLAVRALLAFDDVNRALDDVGVRCLGLQLRAVCGALEASGVEILNHGEPGVHLRKSAL